MMRESRIKLLRTDFKSLLIGLFFVLWLWASGNDGLQDVKISNLQDDIYNVNAIAAGDREDCRIRHEYVLYRIEMIQKAFYDPSLDFSQVKSLKEYVAAGWDRARPVDGEL
jgi:hypothetical protein